MLKFMQKKPALIWIDETQELPNLDNAAAFNSPIDGLIAAGGGLHVNRLREAYAKGLFPWFSQGQPILWWSPDPRMVLQTDHFKLHRSFRKTLQSFTQTEKHEIRIDTAFEATIRHCAQQARAGQNGTWIVEEMIRAYLAFHAAGFAHSLETWIDGQLVGGLYCVNIGQCIFGESMFSLQSNASKIALAALVAFAKAHDISWIDCQQNTPHLASLGAREIHRSQFLEWIRQAKQIQSPRWEFRPIYWQHLLPPKPEL